MLGKNIGCDRGVMRFISILIFLLFSYPAQAELFPYLKKETVDSYGSSAGGKFSLEMNVHYNPKLFERINIKRGEYPGDHPFYIDDAKEYGAHNIVFGIFDLTGNNDRYYLIYSEGPSIDVSYRFYSENQVENAIEGKRRLDKADFIVWAPSIVITGDRNIYSYGHNNSMFDERRKYVYSDGEFGLISQPFLYSGKQTKSLKNQPAYTDETMNKTSFRITEGYPVTVVGIKSIPRNESGITELYLVASKFGLLGWVPVDHSQQETQFEGFFFKGD